MEPITLLFFFFFCYIYINSLELSIVKRKKHFKILKVLTYDVNWKSNNTMGKKHDKGTHDDLQNTTQKSKYWATTNPTKTGGDVRKVKQFLLH